MRLKINRISSLFSIFSTDKEITFKIFFHNLLKEGIYLSPSGLEANFLSTAHNAGDIKNTLKIIDRALKRLGR